MQKVFDIILRSNQGREQKAKLIAEKIRNAKGYSWVGLYDVTERTFILFLMQEDRSQPLPLFLMIRDLMEEPILKKEL
jgi:hypothetical protein